MTSGVTFTWSVILAIISALFGTNHADAPAIVFATLSGVLFLVTLYLVIEET